MEPKEANYSQDNGAATWLRLWQAIKQTKAKGMLLIIELLYGYSGITIGRQ